MALTKVEPCVYERVRVDYKHHKMLHVHLSNKSMSICIAIMCHGVVLVPSMLQIMPVLQMTHIMMPALQKKSNDIRNDERASNDIVFPFVHSSPVPL